MSISSTHLPYGATGYFSGLVTDYLSDHPNIHPFFRYTPDEAGIAQAIQGRNKYPVDRSALVATLQDQYKVLPKYEQAEKNIELLNRANTYTICTAHQPNLLTGYLYFIYKIVHAIKLAEDLKSNYPELNFVPVYYMGSEDNDIEELGTFRFRGDKYVWDGAGQAGAVGRMSTASLKPMLNDLFRLFGPPGINCDELEAMLTEAYMQHDTITAATQYLVNELFGKYGLLVLNPDTPMLKKSFIPVMKDELLQQNAYPIITSQIDALGKHYKIQAHPRLINLFYLSDQVRERIEKHGHEWIVVNTNIRWTERELLDELEQHPERFSPNVMLRGLYQETILPDIAFIGGGAEVAYWMQLSALFDHYKVFFPVILLRQSVLWIGNVASRALDRAGLSVQQIFRKEQDLLHDYVTANSDGQWQTKEESAALDLIFSSLRQKATKVDPTLRSSAEAALVKMKRQAELLETKMLRAEKKKMQIHLQKITKLKNTLFPDQGLQERIENFSEYYLQYGGLFIATLKDNIRPLQNEFLILRDAENN